MLAAGSRKNITGLPFNAFRERLVGRRVTGVKRNDKINLWALGRARRENVGGIEFFKIALDKNHLIGEIETLRHLLRRAYNVVAAVDADYSNVAEAQDFGKIRIKAYRQIRFAAAAVDYGKRFGFVRLGRV